MTKTHTIWKTIKTTATPSKKLIASLEKDGVLVFSDARDIASKVEPKEDTVDLVKVTLSDWFTEYPTIKQIYEKAKEEGLELCPPEIGLFLAKEYTDQPRGERLFIGMERITDSDGNPGVFGVGRRGGGERWLSTYWVDPNYAWNLGHRVVFRLRKSALGTSEPSPSALGALTPLGEAIEMVKEAGYEVYKKM